MRMRTAVMFAMLLGWVAVGLGQDVDVDDYLPPLLPWDGASKKLVRPPEDEWATPCEKGGMEVSPGYGETVQWLKRLCEESDRLSMVSLGTSDEGRDVWMVVARSDEKNPALLAVAGIHAGEIDGKDAGMMLLRDIVKGKKGGLLDRATLLFVPIHSVDGHERSSRFGRVNQRGPVRMGWRTNSRNLNLNRDFAKLDTPEVRALVKAFSDWKPDVYFDIHVTDGADYQYDITWGFNGEHAYSPAISRWLRAELDPALFQDLKAMGHVPGPLVFAVDGKDMAKGNAAPTFGPRFSHGYGDVRHLPAVLVENHSLKPYPQRVLGTYVLLESTLRLLGEKGEGLRKATRKDRAGWRDHVPLTWKRDEKKEPRKVPFLGVQQKVVPADIIGGEQVVFTGEPVTLEIPLLERNVPDVVVKRPRYYWIPPAWRQVIKRLERHGIRMDRLLEAREVEVELYRVRDYELAERPFEGHMRVTAQVDLEKHRVRYPPGTMRVPTDQPLGDLAVLLLEPQSPDSFFQWGFFLEILQRTEYVENYAMVPLARLMLARDPKLKKEYEALLKVDEEFAKDPKARLQWFYERSPWFDARWRLYPVGRE